MTEWKKFTGSEEQVREMNEAKHGWIFRLNNGQEANIRYSHVDEVLNTIKITEYLICNPHPHAEMIKRWADTGQPVYYKNVYGEWHEDVNPDWNPKTEYSFNPPKEKKFIEVRDYLCEAHPGDFRKRTAHKKFSSIEDAELAKGFIRWLDDDWRKVEI